MPDLTDKPPHWPTRSTPAPGPAWPQLRQEYLADLIEESLRHEHEWLQSTRVWRVGRRRFLRRRKPRIPDGLFAHFADQAAWHVIGRTQGDLEDGE